MEKKASLLSAQGRAKGSGRMGKKDRLRAGNVASAMSRNTPLGEIADSNTYNCTGNFQTDFNELWNRAGLDKVGLPVIKSRSKPPKIPDENFKEGEAEDLTQEMDRSIEDLPTTYCTTNNWDVYKPAIQCEFDVEETRQLQTNYAKEIYIRGWRFDDKIVQVLKQCMLERLTTINLWNAGMNDLSVTTLATMLKTLPSVKTLYLEGNPIPDTEPFHLFITEENSLANLFLRNNRITEIGAKNISQALGQFSSSPIVNLNLSFNNLGNEGAKLIAKALRMNRTLVSLSLSSNYIGDEGGIALASVLKTFMLTHEEVVERRKLISSSSTRQGLSSVDVNTRFLLRSLDSRDRPGSNRSGTVITAKGQRGSSKNKKQDAANKKNDEKDKNKKDKKVFVLPSPLASSVTENPKKTKKSGGGKDASKSGKGAASTEEDNDLADPVHPMLDGKVKTVGGKIYLSGCMSLICLNLARNNIGYESLSEFHSVVQFQSSVGRKIKGYRRMPGLLRLYLQKNLFDENDPKWLDIHELLLSRDPIAMADDDGMSTFTTA